MIGLRDVEVARERIHSFIQQTPLWSSTKLSEKTEIPVYLKLEHLQTTGSFKLRGATNAILNLSVAQKKAGVVGVSTGNHGRGLAFAARQADVRCVICMSRLVPQN
ncbi:MAG: pyridoxal-phosphate dependent enzyme, partial [Deltaproteobacteria bacterium]